MSKIRQVYQAIVALSTDGVCRVTQAEIATKAGISKRHCYEVLKRLVEIQAIFVDPAPHHYGPVPRKIYRVEKLMDSQSPLVDKKGPSVEKLMDSQSPLVDKKGPSVDKKGPSVEDSAHHDSCMVHDEKIKKEILNLLDFINEPMRTFCAKRCTLEIAQQWRAVKNFYDQNDTWLTLGLNQNPIGWIVRRIKAGDPPPALQIPLPGGAVDLSEGFKSRGMTREEIESSLRPIEDATLGADGKWR
jgi:hypothetical protein